MAKKLYEEENIRDIACAIREKCGDESKTYKCCDMADAIRALAIAGGEYDITVSANSDGTQTLAIVDASGSGGNSGGGGSAPAVIQALTITKNGTYTVPAGVDGYNPVTVNISSSGSSGTEDDLIMGTLSGAYTNDRVTKVNKYAFTELKSLTSVSLPNVITVDNYGFYYCGNNLTSVDLPKATKIGDSAFYYCKGLTSIDLPKVTSIGTQTFYNCSALATVILRSETMVTAVSSNAFTSTLIASGTGYIYVPSALVNTYKANSKWSTYANQFRALESYTVDGTITGALDATKI